MPITFNSNVFPSNAVTLIKARLAAIGDPNEIYITGRPLRNTDPTYSIGVFGSLWLPNEESYELLGRGIHSPTLDSYLITVQAFVLHNDEETGLMQHAWFAETIRAILDRDPALNVALTTLSTSISGVTKRTSRTGVRQQRYIVNELNSQFLFLSSTEFWLETETS